MPNIISPATNSNQPDDTRAQYIQGLHDLAEWLKANPAAPIPSPTLQRMGMPVMTNTAVVAFAIKHGLTYDFDSDGNASCDVHFGPVALNVYGYANFTTHLAQMNERHAREWADRQGLVIQKTPLAAAS